MWQQNNNGHWKKIHDETMVHFEQVADLCRKQKEEVISKRRLYIFRYSQKLCSFNGYSLRGSNDKKINAVLLYIAVF